MELKSLCLYQETVRQLGKYLNLKKGKVDVNFEGSVCLYVCVWGGLKVLSSITYLTKESWKTFAVRPPQQRQQQPVSHLQQGRAILQQNALLTLNVVHKCFNMCKTRSKVLLPVAFIHTRHISVARFQSIFTIQRLFLHTKLKRFPTLMGHLKIMSGLWQCLNKTWRN